MRISLWHRNLTTFLNGYWHMAVLHLPPDHRSSHFHTRLFHHNSLWWVFITHILTSGSTLLHSDLECDYLNAQECCGRLNFWNIPKLWLQLVILAVLLVSGHWSLVLLNIPVCAWLVRKFHWVPRGNIGKVSVQYPIGNLFSCTLLRSKHEGYMK